MIGLGWSQAAPTFVAVVVLAVVALIGGSVTDVGEWYEGLRFPALRPPNWLFGPAWTAIYVCIAVSSVMAWDRATDGQRVTLVVLFAINAVLNVVWSPLFFKLRRPDWALAELIPFWLSILAMVIVFYSIRPLAALVVLPYLVWVTFAGWLNWRIVVLNRPFVGRRAPRVR